MNSNPMQMIQAIMNLRRDPTTAMKQFGIPSDMAQSPDKMIQFLMDSGRISQAQYMQARQMAGSISKQFK